MPGLRIRIRLASSILAPAFLLASWGCGGGGGQSVAVSKMQPVAGKVSYRGRPLTKGRLLFESDLSGREAYAEIGPDGSYSLKTKDKEGAALGKHRVALMDTTPALPKQYASVSSSKIEVDVEEGKTDYPINIP